MNSQLVITVTRVEVVALIAIVYWGGIAAGYLLGKFHAYVKEN